MVNTMGVFQGWTCNSIKTSKSAWEQIHMLVDRPSPEDTSWKSQVSPELLMDE